MRFFYVYLLCSKKFGTLYIGCTNDLAKRIDQHKNKVVKSFTEKYNVDKLVHVEVFDTIDQARKRERQLKSWRRDWKFELISKNNPNWEDLSDKITP